MIWLIVIGGLLVAALVLYWVIVIGEGSYFGRSVVRLIYQAGAGIYDQVHQPVTATDQALLGEPLRAALLQQPFMPALDVATGTGRVPLLLAAEEWYSGAIIGLDLAAAMLDQARRKAQLGGVEARIEWVLGSDSTLRQWPDNSFGLVTCLEAVEYFPRPRRALRELWRVLQPGGTLIISTWTRRHARWLPGKALTAQQVGRLLDDLGCTYREVRVWQPGQYDLVIAVKGAADTPHAHQHEC